MGLGESPSARRGLNRRGRSTERAVVPWRLLKTTREGHGRAGRRVSLARPEERRLVLARESGGDSARQLLLPFAVELGTTREVNGSCSADHEERLLLGGHLVPTSRQRFRRLPAITAVESISAVPSKITRSYWLTRYRLGRFQSLALAGDAGDKTPEAARQRRLQPYRRAGQRMRERERVRVHMRFGPRRTGAFELEVAGLPSPARGG